MFVRFGPAAPAVGVSRRDNHSREQRTMTYSHEGTLKLVLLLHMNMLHCPATSDGRLEQVEHRSMAAVVAADDREQMHRMWWKMKERPAQAGSDRDTRTRPFPQSLDDRLMVGDVPDQDVRTVYEAGGVGERQDESRRYGGACDSLCHEDEGPEGDLDHRRKAVPDTAQEEDSQEAVADAGKDLEEGGGRVVGREHRRVAYSLVEDTEHDHHAEAASDQRSSDAGMQCGRAQRLALVKRLV